MTWRGSAWALARLTECTVPLAGGHPVRNVVDDYLADGVDDMQKEVARRCDGVRWAGVRTPFAASRAPETQASKWTEEEKAVVDAVRHRMRRRAARSRAAADDPFARQCFSKLLSTLRRVFDINFDKFDAYALRNVFSVPPALYPHLDVRGAGQLALAGCCPLSLTRWAPILCCRQLEGVPSGARGDPPSEEAEKALDERLDRAHTQLQALRTVRAQVCAELQFYAKHLDPLEEEVTAVRAAWAALDGGDGAWPGSRPRGCSRSPRPCACAERESPMQALGRAEALRPRAEERITELAGARGL